MVRVAAGVSVHRRGECKAARVAVESRIDVHEWRSARIAVLNDMHGAHLFAKQFVNLGNAR